MIKSILILLLSTLFISSGAQVVFPFEDIKLEEPGDYAATEPLALAAANVIITQPYVNNDANRTNAGMFLSKWMTGSKEFNFYLQGMVYDVKEDKVLLSMYIAAMAKFSIENKTQSVNPMTVEKNASKMVLAYYGDPKNNVKLRKKYRKLLEAK